MIDYASSLNQPQYEAVTSTDDALLIIAGAGSGKTRTIVYRIAWLAEQGIDPSSMLLLTFTRKAAQEMLERCNNLLGSSLNGVHGGTFHSFAYRTLKLWHPAWLGDRPFSLLDAADIQNTLKYCKAELKVGTGIRSFPKIQSIQGIISKARNTEQSIHDILARDSYQLLPFADAIADISLAYTRYKREQGLLDYDDLLFELESLLQNNTLAAGIIRDRYCFVMVDEYQDTNPVQARIIELLARPDAEGKRSQIMAVGDEAQSIYSFRGATIRNILSFPDVFPKTRIIRLEENYRSTQPVLDVANTILASAHESFHKILFTKKGQGQPVFLYEPFDEHQQAEYVVSKINELLKKYPPEEIAVLFRSGFHSYFVELGLNTHRLPFQKYGGLKYTEAAHIKDCLAFTRLLLNPLDFPAFSRVAAMHPGIGPKTIQVLFAESTIPEKMRTRLKKYPSFADDLSFIESLKTGNKTPAEILSSIIDYYQPRLESTYFEDWPSRKQGLEEIVDMAAQYSTLEDFIADLILESPEEGERNAVGKIVLSTIHSAKGLEWDAVLLIDLVSNRFPSHHAEAHPEDMEEERRLMYVACTRARKELYLYAPQTIFNRMEGFNVDAVQSPFLANLSDLAPSSFENLGSHRNAKKTRREEGFPSFHTHVSNKPSTTSSKTPKPKPKGEKIVFGTNCRHPIFGRGKVLGILDKDIIEVSFVNYGCKKIHASYLSFED